MEKADDNATPTEPHNSTTAVPSSVDVPEKRNSARSITSEVTLPEAAETMPTTNTTTSSGTVDDEKKQKKKVNRRKIFASSKKKTNESSSDSDVTPVHSSKPKSPTTKATKSFDGQYDNNDAASKLSAIFEEQQRGGIIRNKSLDASSCSWDEVGSLPALRKSATDVTSDDEKPLSNDLNNPFKLYCDGLEQFRRKEYLKAQTSFQEAIDKTTTTANSNNNDDDENKKEEPPNVELAKMLEHHGNASFKLGQCDTAEDSYKKAVQIFQREENNNNSEYYYKEHIAKIMMKRGDLQTSMGNTSRADLHYHVSLKLWKEVLLTDDNTNTSNNQEEKNNHNKHVVKLCHALYNTGIINVKLSKLKEGETLFEKILSIISNNFDLINDFRTIKLAIWANNAIGNIRTKNRVPKEAIEYYETALGLQKMYNERKEAQKDGVTWNDTTTHNDDNDDDHSADKLIGLYTNLGKAYYQQKLFEKAMICFQKADRILMKESRKDEVSLASIWTQMGKICFRQGEHEDARDFYRDALDIEKKLVQQGEETNNQKILLLRHDIALTYCKEGNYEKGLEIMEDILLKEKKKKENAERKNSLYVAKIHLDLCAVYVKLGNIRKMISSFSSASQILGECNIPENHAYMHEKRVLEGKIAEYTNVLTTTSKGH